MRKSTLCVMYLCGHGAQGGGSSPGWSRAEFALRYVVKFATSEFIFKVTHMKSNSTHMIFRKSAVDSTQRQIYNISKCCRSVSASYLCDSSLISPQLIYDDCRGDM